MTIEQLRQDVNSRLPRPASVEFADLGPRCLGTSEPDDAGSYNIYVSSDFENNEDADNIEAHEFAHVQLSLNGLIALAPTLECGEHQKLKSTINNAISHCFVVETVERYGLSNQVFFSFLDDNLEEDFDKLLHSNDEPIRSHIDGIYLYDISRIRPILQGTIDEILRSNQEAQRAHEAAVRHLDVICQEMTREQQAERIVSLLRELGYEFLDEPELDPNRPFLYLTILL